MIRPDPRRAVRASGVLLAAILAALPFSLGSPSAAAARGAGHALLGSPITHVVVLYQENHSFNDLLGKLCVNEQHRCEGTTVGLVSDGSRITLSAEPDIPPSVGHDRDSQIAAIHGGAMDGWDHVALCSEQRHYTCLTQVGAGRVPTLWSLADAYTISDQTFESGKSGSWGSHLALVAATFDGFTGDNPVGPPIDRGDGCDSRQVALWSAGRKRDATLVPTCVPDQLGNGPFKASPVRYVPTIMDLLDAAGRSWHIYAPGRAGSGYGWAICPTFYECLGGPQQDQVRRPRDFARDASKGKLANVSIVIPFYNDSQHNGESLIKGDDWIAENVSAVMNGPDWGSTAIFITYDDCGCFYDPVAPPKGAGIRVPMVIVSPYAKPRFVDHGVATDASMLAFIEGVFGLPHLPHGDDARAYGYADAFDFAQAPLPPLALPQHRVPASSLRYMASHPRDPDDPT